MSIGAVAIGAAIGATAALINLVAGGTLLGAAISYVCFGQIGVLMTASGIFLQR